MAEAPRRAGSGNLTKLAAVAFVLILMAAAILYFYPSLTAASSGPGITFTFPPTTTKSTTKTTGSTSSNQHTIQLQSALIFNDTLSMRIKNTGTDWTQSLTVAGICLPGFKGCYSYASGKAITKAFFLAPQGSYVENITGVCVVPVTNCNYYYPVVNFTYYFQVNFKFESGATTSLAVIAMANNTYPYYSAVSDLQYQLTTFPKNGSGALNVNIIMNSSLDHATFIGTLFTRATTGALTVQLLSNKTACGSTLAIDCSSGNLTLTDRFSSVTTGIGTPYSPLPYLLVVRDLTVRRLTYFAVWVPTVDTG